MGQKFSCLLLSPLMLGKGRLCSKYWILWQIACSCSDSAGCPGGTWNAPNYCQCFRKPFYGAVSQYAIFTVIISRDGSEVFNLANRAAMWTINYKLTGSSRRGHFMGETETCVTVSNALPVIICIWRSKVRYTTLGLRWLHTLMYSNICTKV